MHVISRFVILSSRENLSISHIFLERGFISSQPTAFMILRNLFKSAGVSGDISFSVE